MKAIATLTLGATAFVGAYASGAFAEESKDTEFRESTRTYHVTDERFGEDGAQGFRLVVDEQAPKVTAETPVAPVAPQPDETTTVRMVVESTDDNGDMESTLCVFVPAGDESAGAISCPGTNVRIFEFGPEHGRQYIIGDDVVDSEEIRERVQERMEALRERLQERGDWDVEFVDPFDNEEYALEMERLEEQMDALADSMDFDFDDPENLSPEDRAQFNSEMQRFSARMAEFGRQMAELQAEAMAEVAADLARHRGERFPTAPMAPRYDLNWTEHGPHDGINRQVIRVESNGEEHVTVIEQHRSDDDGMPRFVIRTTDPELVEVVHIEAEELDDE